MKISLFARTKLSHSRPFPSSLSPSLLRSIKLAFLFTLVIPFLLSFSLSFSHFARAGEADVIQANTKRNTDGTYRFDVTVKSKDTGWDYYAERFEVLSLDGKILGTRVLLHPHEDEQPFTREVDGVKIPAGTVEIKVRALMKRKGKTDNEKHDGAVLTIKVRDAQK